MFPAILNREWRVSSSLVVVPLVVKSSWEIFMIAPVCLPSSLGELKDLTTRLVTSVSLGSSLFPGKRCQAPAELVLPKQLLQSGPISQ